MSQETGKTGTDNVTFDLVSILYHSLEGASTYEKYIKDAQGSGNNDLVQFFRDAQQEERRRAERCQQLLQQHLGRSGSMGQRRAA